MLLFFFGGAAVRVGVAVGDAVVVEGRGEAVADGEGVTVGDGVDGPADDADGSRAADASAGSVSRDGERAAYPAYARVPATRAAAMATTALSRPDLIGSLKSGAHFLATAGHHEGSTTAEEGRRTCDSQSHP